MDSSCNIKPKPITDLVSSLNEITGYLGRIEETVDGKVFFGDSGDAGILASRFLIKILKSSETQN